MARNARKFISRVKVSQDIRTENIETIEDAQKVIKKLVEAVNDTNRELDNVRKFLEDLPLVFGNGSPENNVVAKLGALYVNLEGGTNTTLYIKESNDKKADGWVSV